MPDTPVLMVEILEIDKKFRKIKDSYVEGNINEFILRLSLKMNGRHVILMIYYVNALYYK